MYFERTEPGNYTIKLFELEGVDVASFKIINTQYGKDKAHVFYREKMIEGASQKGFIVLRNSHKNSVAKDEKYAFFNGKIKENSDAKSFKIINEQYAVDKNQAYVYDDIIPTKHAHNFKLLKGFYATDGVDIYYGEHALNVCSTSNFRVLHQGKFNMYPWSTDGCFYYIHSNKIPSTHYDDMVIYEDSEFSKDNNFVYDKKGKINYKNDVKLFDVDVASFSVDKYGNAHDKDGYYDYERRHSL